MIELKMLGFPILTCGFLKDEHAMMVAFQGSKITQFRVLRHKSLPIDDCQDHATEHWKLKDKL